MTPRNARMAEGGIMSDPHPFESPAQTLANAKRCFVAVAATEWYVRVSKSEVRELKKHLGGCGRFILSCPRRTKRCASDRADRLPVRQWARDWPGFGDS